MSGILYYENKVRFLRNYQFLNNRKPGDNGEREKER